MDSGEETKSPPQSAKSRGKSAKGSSSKKKKSKKQASRSELEELKKRGRQLRSAKKQHGLLGLMEGLTLETIVAQPKG